VNHIAAPTNVSAATDQAIAGAAAALRNGRLVAFPTETVYGLGADATNDAAVARIFAAKDRPQFNPLIAHLPNAEVAFALTVTNEQARRLAKRFWPGPLTLVLPRAGGCRVSLLATAGLDTLAVRVPDHPVALALLRAAACPIAAPSANRSGHVSPTTAAHVAESLDGAPDIILDGGACPVGLESTVIDLSGLRPALLRPGGIATEDIEKVIGPIAAATSDGIPRAPGMLARHYAPHRPLRTGATTVRGDEALLAFGPQPLTGAALTRNLSVTADVIEAAANLFAMLRELDRADVTAIAAMPVPETGLGRAINDRLRRAAHR
jgi:L-threonylcarbamoyladenylate synthase